MSTSVSDRRASGFCANQTGSVTKILNSVKTFGPKCILRFKDRRLLHFLDRCVPRYRREKAIFLKTEGPWFRTEQRRDVGRTSQALVDSYPGNETIPMVESLVSTSL